MPTLHFKGKSVIETHHHTVPHHTLDFDKKLSVLDKGQEPSLDGNLIIEGDNLLALKALLPTHAGKVKCVYIDPPYNTGKEEWVYNDNLTQPQFKEWIGQTVGKEGEDFSRHDKWCCMMYPRLSLLKELLAPDGVMFVSIDENEFHNLRLIVDELFGIQNRVGTIVWKGATDNNPTLIAIEHEYILCVAKDKRNLPTRWIQPEPTAKQIILGEYERLATATKDLDEIQNGLREFIKTHLEECTPLTHYDRIDPVGPYTGSRKVHNPGREGYRYDVIHPVTKKPCKLPARGYRFPPATMDQLLKSDRIIYGDDENQIIQIKEYLRDYVGPLKSVIHLDSRAGANALEAIFGNREVFKGPKPVELLSSVIGFAIEDGDIVLDSFAGSGSTAHAMLDLCSERSDLRRGVNFILVQQKYDSREDRKERKNIAKQITRERVKRVIDGYSREKQDRGGNVSVEPIASLGGSFTYARLSDEPLFGDYRDLGDKLPAYDDIAAYVFYTETSHEWKGSDRRKNKAFDKKSGRIGEHQGTSYYLLYRPNDERDWGLSLDFAYDVLADDPNTQLVVYCEKISLHRDQLRKFAGDSGRHVRPMLVPFNLK
ncbi:MAG: site-specific DNA-methyltransferase [Planctomycetota bacterium]